LRSQIVAQSIVVQKQYDDLPMLMGYEGKIKQVCMNILNNAIQALQHQQKPIIVIRTTLVNKQVILEIMDNGIGMDDKTQQKIFEPFFTTKDVGSGTGLGLSISFAIIKKHKGSIEVKSNPNKGTHFIITLPV
jgi:signal transduction histidine kinase